MMTVDSPDFLETFISNRFAQALILMAGDTPDFLGSSRPQFPPSLRAVMVISRRHRGPPLRPLRCPCTQATEQCCDESARIAMNYGRPGGADRGLGTSILASKRWRLEFW